MGDSSPNTGTPGLMRSDRPQSTAIYALGTRLSGTIVSLAGSILILLLLSPERIGVFLTVGSLAAFSGIADLGLNYSFLLAAAARPEKDAAPLITVALTVLIPTVTATGTILLVAGAIFLHQVEIPTKSWLWPWISYCVLASFHQVFLLAVTYVEGTGRRDVAWRAHFWIEAAAGIGFLSMIAMHLELWAFAAGSLIRIAMVLFLFRGVFRMPEARSDAPSMRYQLALWLAEFWPMQWKTIANNLGGLISTRLLTPMLFAAQGAATAGRVGLALSLAISIVGISSAWPLSQTALYTALYHQGRASELKSVFISTCRRSLLLSVGICFGVGIACEVLRHESGHMAARLPDSEPLWLILGAAVMAHLSYCFAILLRARRTDPVVFAYLIFTIPALVAYWFAAHVSVMLFAVVYFLTGSFFAALYARYLPPFFAAV